jgi:hypothetical protein
MEKQKDRPPELEQSVRVRAVEVAIPFKTPELTSAALESATSLGHQLSINLRLIHVHVVPYPLPLDKPSVCCDHLENKLRRIAERSSIPVQPELIFARDWEEGFRRALRPRSVILMPIQKSWWRSHDKRMAERLRKHGHQVIWVDCE